MKQKKRKDGRLCRTFTFGNKRYYIYGYDTQELNQKEFEKRQQLTENKIEHDNPTIDTFFDRWQENRMGSVKESTIYNEDNRYMCCSTIMVGDKRFGEYRLDEVRTDDVRKLQKYFIKNGIKPQTINNRISLISRLFKDAVLENYISYNPCLTIKPLKKTDEQARDNIHRALTQAETEAFFKEAENSFYYDLFRMAIFTGMRFGELTALYNSDIRNDLIHVERTTTVVDGNRILGSSTKTSKKRVIPVNADIREAIEHQRTINSILDGDKVINIKDVLFKSSRRGLMSSSAVNGEILRICKKTGIEKFTFHCFRDTFATRALENGMNPKTLQEILGHSSFAMTMDTYAHCLTETKVKAMEQLKIVL
ncbi:tyrosine-type recombinase/integrase [Butyrivibrio sp. AD3002]|uniref:tyrosine-type recombinase/integrase n=1 Tax=Butyrivibrio sp. AD3002 TaxID=1280670 RepID=UPI0003B6BF81|nr:site-specific integrase [Butyrivibrio sp. AD3002]